MSEEAAATGTGAEVITHVAGGSGELSAREAGRSLSDFRNKMLAGAAEPRKDDKQDASAETATPAHESEVVEATDDAAPIEGPSEAEQADPAEELPSIDPPRSWTKEDKELFTGLPRETQERLASGERSRETDFLRRQNEAAEQLKGLTAKEQAAEQARQQYEAASHSTLQTLFELQSGNFPDIKSYADAQKLAIEDPSRYSQWRATQDLIEANQREVSAAQQRRQQEFTQQWSEYAKQQDRLLNERAPELADKTTAERWTKAAQETLADAGFKPEELGQAWDGKASLSLRDARTQLLILKAAKYDESQKQQKAVKTAVAKKDLPPVQRPGAAKTPNAGSAQEAKALESRLPQSSGMAAIRLGVQHMQAKRRASQ